MQRQQVWALQGAPGRLGPQDWGCLCCSPLPSSRGSAARLGRGLPGTLRADICCGGEGCLGSSWKRFPPCAGGWAGMCRPQVGSWLWLRVLANPVLSSVFLLPFKQRETYFARMRRAHKVPSTLCAVV